MKPPRLSAEHAETAELSWVLLWASAVSALNVVFLLCFTRSEMYVVISGQTAEFAGRRTGIPNAAHVGALTPAPCVPVSRGRG